MSNAGVKSLPQLGNGLEGVVYRTGNDALKIFRRPDDAYFQGDDQASARETVKRRLNSYAGKFQQFPAWIGSRVVTPSYLVRLGNENRIDGYGMPLVTDGVPLSKYMNRKWKSAQAISISQLGLLALDLYSTLEEVHACGAIIGDIKPQNMLVLKHKFVNIIDSESMGYGDYPCNTFTEGYVDPTHCDHRLDYEELRVPHSQSSDWYAYVVILFQLLTNLHPYAGVYRPPPGSPIIKQSERALRGISVFHEQVKVPNLTDGIRALTQELQDYFRATFDSQMREKPSRELIAQLCNNGPVSRFHPAQGTCWKAYHMEL